MDESKLPLLKGMYEEVKQNEPYKSRYNKLKVVPVFKKIILETLQNEPLTNEHLTGLIHMFKHNCSADTFDKYLKITVPDNELRNKLSEEGYDANENGFTNAGLQSIQKLNKKELAVIKQFLIASFKVKTIEEGITLCKEYIKQNIQIVTEGIYSPWLFYINPAIFPLVNQGIKGFRSWIKLSKNYADNIEEFHLISKTTGETNLGLIDALTTSITSDGVLNLFRKLYLNDSSLYKISHGIFVKKTEFIESGIIKILEEKNWIALSRYTGKGAGPAFEKELKIGDYVYLCYGGDRIINVGKVISEAKPFEQQYAEMLDDDEEEWIYREIEPIYLPVDSNIRDLKSLRSQTMPSGNSTFWKIKSNDLEYLNDNIFIPKFNLEILKNKESEIEDDDELTDYSEDKTTTMSKNTILYGPPGTGKTFHSINHAVAIVENIMVEEVANENRELVKNRFDQYIKDGQVVFCTFHQSLSYEDFIEGIKPIEPESEDEQLYYAVEDGIFKRLCTVAAFSFVKQQTNADTEKALDFSTAYDNLVDTVNERFSKGEKIEIPTRSGGNITIESVSQKGNIRVRHIDGNRTYGVSKKRLSKISQAFPDLSEVTNINDQFRAVIGGSNSSAYWAVLNAVRSQSGDTSAKTIIDKVEKDYSYEDKKEIIESFKAENYKIVNPKKFVLIIDEINRGNVSQIFGELITLIEEDKRLGKEEALKATLPSSGESFGVPHNLFIVGTMNTADRSVEALDTALRRRFSFVHKQPEEEKLSATSDGIDLTKLLSTINNRLKVLKDTDHTIGHAWLWNVKDVNELKVVFANKILPLLQEYFYNDYEKLGLVLGDAFFKTKLQVNSNIFAAFSGGNGLAGQYDQSWQYELKPAQELTLADFKALETQINQQANDED